MSQPDAPPHQPASPGWSAPPAGAYAPPPGYAPPAGYVPPAGYPAPGAGAPVPGSGSQGAASVSSYGTPAPAPRGGALGLVALGLALFATIGASVLGGIAAFRIGVGAGREITTRAFDADFDWSVLAPVRDWVLTGEVAFWAGTVIGLWALVQGVVAMVTGRGRGAGIAAVVVAALGPIVFGVVMQGFLTAGLTAGSGIGG
ncbi:hypothetical protein ACFT30_09080 [Microbacterium ureisolvens]|uniref:hypothetical protein n=1 Tax=Microbacterium ureisolvens TaxID=2781186 RepID=UPI003635F1A8